ncbi:MAG: hypothetical protein PHI18_05795 [bacterium]|nr:hypothetical protein [bacterium]
MKSQETATPQDIQLFDMAFLGSLVPGIVHNLATPMSGVLGATQLLENRIAALTELVKNIRELDEARRDELLSISDRNRASVDILARNARHLADLLQVLVQRLTRSSAATREFYCLNDLLQNELRFLDANLTFKHKVKKQLLLAPHLPAVRCVYGHVAAAIDEFVTGIVAAHEADAQPLEMGFATESETARTALILTARFAPSAAAASLSSPTLAASLERLRADGWEIEWQESEGVQQLRLTFPRTPAAA